MSLKPLFPLLQCSSQLFPVLYHTIIPVGLHDLPNIIYCADLHVDFFKNEVQLAQCNTSTQTTHPTYLIPLLLFSSFLMHALVIVAPASGIRSIIRVATDYHCISLNTVKGCVCTFASSRSQRQWCIDICSRTIIYVVPRVMHAQLGWGRHISRATDFNSDPLMTQTLCIWMWFSVLRLNGIQCIAREWVSVLVWTLELRSEWIMWY